VSWIGRLARPLVITFLVLWSLFPLAVALSGSITPTRDLDSYLVPREPTLDHFRRLLSFGSESAVAEEFLQALKVSGITVLIATLAILVVACSAGYALARLSFRLRGAVFLLVIVTLAVPTFLLIVPLYRLMADLELIGTLRGLVLLYVGLITPFAVWLFANACRELPVETEEAARLDGCGRLRVFLWISLPQLRSSIAALAAIVALQVWGAFFIPLIFAPTPESKPATVLITEYVTRFNSDYPLQAAASVILVVPAAILAIMLNKQIRGMLSGW
jgi:multiple sugar transport system permease protein